MKILIFAILFVSILSGNAVSALDQIQQNATDFEKAKICINYSQSIIEKMKIEGFQIIRINDSFAETLTLYDAQLILKEKNKSAGFSSITSYCQEIEAIYKNAISAKDQIAALKKFYNISLEEVANKSSVDSIIDKIIELMGNLPRIELFARQTVPGWDCWGNETKKFNGGNDGEI